MIRKTDFPIGTKNEQLQTGKLLEFLFSKRNLGGDYYGEYK